MAQWAKAQRLTGGQGRLLRDLYNNYFPLEARHHFAEWLEAQSWNDIDPDNSQHTPVARQHFVSFLHLIEQRIQECGDEGDFLLRHQLDNVVGTLRLRFGNSPLEFVRIVRHCLATEINLLQSEDAAIAGPIPTLEPNKSERHASIDQAVQRLRLLIEDIENNIKTLQQKQESVVIQTEELVRVRSALTSMTQASASSDAEAANVQVKALVKARTALESALMKEAEALVVMRKGLYKRTDEMLNEYKLVQTTILDEELMTWQRSQQLAGVGGPPAGPLDQLHVWCQNLADIIWRCRRQVQQMEHLKTHVPVTNTPDVELDELNVNVNNLLCLLITRTFILDKQPPQVLKTMTRFGACVMLLAGGRQSGFINHSEVQAHIISEKQARGLACENAVPIKAEVSGEICNNTKVMDLNKTTGTLSAEFNNMSLRRIKRPDKKGPEHQLAVTEEKFCILFTSKFSLGSGELVYSVRTVSLPVVVVVHVNQSPAAEATILWDNAFAEPGRIPFDVPAAVPWTHMAHALSLRFQATNGRGLDEQHLSLLCSKVFPGQLEDPNLLFPWGKLHKENLLNRSFTFWDWFYGTCDLVKRHLHAQWQDGLIAGFVSRQQAEDLLLSEPLHDNFILRFSDSEVGGLTTAYSMLNPNSGVREVYHLQPWTARDFTIRALADRVHDLLELKNLFPNIPKGDVFGKYYTPSQPSGSGTGSDFNYVSTRIIVVAENGPPRPNGNGTEANIPSPMPTANTSSPPTPATAHDIMFGTAASIASPPSGVMDMVPSLTMASSVGAPSAVNLSDMLLDMSAPPVSDPTMLQDLLDLYTADPVNQMN